MWHYSSKKSPSPSRGAWRIVKPSAHGVMSTRSGLRGKATIISPPHQVGWAPARSRVQIFLYVYAHVGNGGPLAGMAIAPE